MFSPAYELLGAGILGVAKLAQRSAVRAKVKRHRDIRGRFTPYLECGEAKAGTIIWLHGFSDEPDSFLRAALPLIRNYRVLVPAMPGFGAGWNDPSERHTFESYAEWLSEVAHDIGDQRYHLMGNSLGGATAMAIAAAHSDGHIASLTLVNSAGLDLDGVRSVNDEMREGQNLFAVRDREGYERFLKRIFARTPFIPGAVRAHLATKLRGSATWYERLVSDIVESERLDAAVGVKSIASLTSIDVPTLIVWGNRDTLFPLAHGEQLARMIPNAKLEVLDGVGHCPHLESPARLTAAFERFAASIAK